MRVNWTITYALLLAGVTSCATSETIQAPPSNVVVQPNFVSHGNQFAKDGMLREAVEAYTKAIGREPQNLTAFRNLGIVLLKSGDAPSAIINIEKSLKEYEDNFDANFYLAEAYRAEEKNAEAIFRYKKALKISPNDLRALKSLAWSYFKIRFYSEALSTANAVLTVARDDDQAPVIIARTQLKLKRPTEALATLTRVLKGVDKLSEPYIQSVVGEVLMSQGKSAEALETFQRAIKAQPMLASALFGAGQILLANGLQKEATEYLERAVRLRPKMYDAQYWLARSIETSDPKQAIRYFASFRKNSLNDPDFIDLVFDARHRSAALTAKAKQE